MNGRWIMELGQVAIREAISEYVEKRRAPGCPKQRVESVHPEMSGTGEWIYRVKLESDPEFPR